MFTVWGSVSPVPSREYSFSKGSAGVQSAISRPSLSTSTLPQNSAISSMLWLIIITVLTKAFLRDQNEV